MYIQVYTNTLYSIFLYNTVLISFFSNIIHYIMKKKNYLKLVYMIFLLILVNYLL